MGNDEKFLTTPQIATLAGVSRRTVVRWCESGELKAYRYGMRGRWRVLRADWDLFKRENRTEGNMSLHGNALVLVN